MAKQTSRKHRRINAERFRAEGFYTTPTSALLEIIQDGDRELWNYCEQLNRAAMRTAWALRPRKSVREQVVGALLFIKALNSYQGSLVLLQRGMMVEGEALCRTGLECAFELGAIAKDTTRIDALHQAHERHQALHAQRLLDHDAASGHVLNAAARASLEQQAALGGSRANLEHAAAAAGLQTLYDASYRGISGYAAHATFGALQRLVKEDGERISIQMGPDMGELSHALISAAPVVLECFAPLARIFNDEALSLEGTRLAVDFTKAAAPSLVRRAQQA